MGYFDGRDGALPTEERPGNSSVATTCTTNADQLIRSDQRPSRLTEQNGTYSSGPPVIRTDGFGSGRSRAR